jgi:hypothetical protein
VQQQQQRRRQPHPAIGWMQRPRVGMQAADATCMCTRHAWQVRPACVARTMVGLLTCQHMQQGSRSVHHVHVGACLSGAHLLVQQ